MEQQLAAAQGFMIPRTARHILSDVGVDEPGSIWFEVDVSVANIRFSFAKGFDFGAVKDEAGFQPFEKMIVIARRAILGDDGLLGLLGLFCGLGHSRSL